MKRISYVLLTAFLVLTATASAQTLDEILAKNFEARGGLDKIKAVQSLKATGTLSIQGGMMQGEFTMWQKRPNKLLMEVNVQGMEIVQAYDGEKTWRVLPTALGGSGTAEEFSDAQAEQLIEQADMDGLLVDYKEKGHQVELVGKEDMEGTEVYRLKVTMASGLVTHVFLDAENFIELKYTATRELPGFGDAEVDTVLGDYKEVGGVMVPHSIANKVTGQTISELIFNTLESNLDIEDSKFSMNH